MGFLVAEYAFHTYLNLRQRSAVLTKAPPSEITEQYSEKYVAQAYAYSIDTKNFALVKGACDFAESVAVLHFMLLPMAWSWSQRAIDAINLGWVDNEYIVSVAFVSLTLAFETTKKIPWSLYGVFVIDERHGINKQTLSVFFMDIFMSLTVMLAFAPPILTCIVYILRLSSAYTPLYLWAFLFCLQMLFMTVYPTLVAPLFNTYEPLKEGSLRAGIENLAASLGFPLEKLYVMDGSKHSGHSNAYMYGFGKNKCIVLYDTLLKQCTESQVIAVLAHELGHWKLGHTRCLMLTQQLIMLAQFMLFAVFRGSDHLLEEFGFVGDAKPVIVSMTLFMTMTGPTDKLITWLFNVLSRRFEFQADKFAADMKHSEHLIEALKVLDRGNTSDFVVDPLFSQYHYSHPPIAERIQAMAASAKEKVR
jgi:STE24 endopeptidase